MKYKEEGEHHNIVVCFWVSGRNLLHHICICPLTNWFLKCKKNFSINNYRICSLCFHCYWCSDKESFAAFAFVVGSLLCSERFFSKYSSISFSSKKQHFQIPILAWEVTPHSLLLWHTFPNVSVFSRSE